MENNIHSFIICAYKENPYLEDCIQSLKKQTVSSPIYISTSTPNEHINNLAKKYNIKLYVNKDSKGHIEDFNFAFSKSKTKYVTLCHQDDIYLPNFAQQVIDKMEKNNNALFSFTDYHILKNDKLIKINAVLLFKRFMNFPYKFNFLNKLYLIKKINLSLGNSISAPTVTFNTQLLDCAVAKSNFKSNIDWISWIEFSKLKGSFVYINKPLLLHRINELSTTTNVIQNNIKRQEDIKIFNMFWPKFITSILITFYGLSEKDNNLKEEK